MLNGLRMFSSISMVSLPTFTAVNALTVPTDPMDQTLKRAIRSLEIISRKGMLKYMVLRFQK